ncbi:serine/arginine repetitive matrix protein 2-like [Ischnura elegans]|uniref:serine/arginine repetitive matrix protein 2-like n=1 Tax=Ischnura elegans TaxID=197161 RepID=UPI001ED86F68|nr:serine/arginine repetitive matrix protein 2-like [Ischnura elegans]
MANIEVIDIASDSSLDSTSDDPPMPLAAAPGVPRTRRRGWEGRRAQRTDEGGEGSRRQRNTSRSQRRTSAPSCEQDRSSCERLSPSPSQSSPQRRSRSQSESCVRGTSPDCSEQSSTHGSVRSSTPVPHSPPWAASPCSTIILSPSSPSVSPPPSPSETELLSRLESNFWSPSTYYSISPPPSLGPPLSPICSPSNSPSRNDCTSPSKDIVEPPVNLQSLEDSEDSCSGCPSQSTPWTKSDGTKSPSLPESSTPSGCPSSGQSRSASSSSLPRLDALSPITENRAPTELSVLRRQSLELSPTTDKGSVGSDPARTPAGPSMPLLDMSGDEAPPSSKINLRTNRRGRWNIRISRPSRVPPGSKHSILRQKPGNLVKPQFMGAESGRRA